MQVVGHQIDRLYPRFLRAVVEQARIIAFSSNAGFDCKCMAADGARMLQSRSLGSEHSDRAEALVDLTA